ncbi:Dopey, N-terminal-domain-containing protein [Lentinula edodes]|uniref:Dopey, N-terminal-domain-containing protein n=1 Tax=Lentinula edodes TaxID=5353 RepID=UPI001E8D5F2B|nr:Dopey, N-terminal-domain-containing protein [Lentinula edodes]KAH7875407.1 Dopey, N-terminal-domain-containing protein [Lentinula edodes]
MANPNGVVAQAVVAQQTFASDPKYKKYTQQVEKFHQRALDVYSHILAVLGVTGLRPVMKSFILALLPGLEEETGEFFERVISLLDRLSGTVSPSFFFQNIWLIMSTTPSARGTALNLLSRRLPQLHGLEDITSIVGSDIGLMISAFAAALEDENLLVQRSALDLLLQSMRVDSSAVKQAQSEDRSILMRAAISVVLQRDLSLNRRLYSWLLGPGKKSEKQIEYLKDNALELLRSTLKEDMLSPSGEYSESRPFKIFISLLDKWEIGAALSEVLIYDSKLWNRISIGDDFSVLYSKKSLAVTDEIRCIPYIIV